MEKMNDNLTDDRRLDALSSKLKRLRDEAIKGRADSGIETIWTEDQEYYDGIDDANRAEKWVKPSTADGRVTRPPKPKKSTRSTVFLRLTTRYVNAAAAYVSDKLFRSDVSNYGMRPTPKPSLVQQTKDMSQAMGPDGQPVQEPVMDEQGQPQMQPQMINGQPMIDQATGKPVTLPKTQPVTVAEIAKKKLKQAKESCEKAKVQIDDWLNEGGINGHSRQVVGDAARIGTGVLKGPFPEMVKNSAVIEDEQGVRLIIEEKLVPRSRRISVWNLYPDPSCGTDIHRGKYIFEDDEINSRLLSELKNDPSYIASAIDRILEEGPKHAVNGTSKRNRTYQQGQDETYQIWYFHGYLSAEDLESCGYEFEEEAEVATEDESGLLAVEGQEESAEQCPKPERKDQYPCIVVMVNDTVIKATASLFDSGRFPYHVMRWQYMDDHWAGVGIGRMMRTSQDGANASVRMMHDNAGVSGAPILIFDRSKITPADGSWTVGPHKVYYTTEDYDGGNIRDAITWIVTPSLQVEMMNYIQFWMRMAEEETGMPMLLQGQQGNIEHTATEAQMLNNNGSSLLRRVTNIYDDDVTKRHIGAYYEWLLLHGDDNSMKGDFTVDAIGSSVLIERDAQSQVLMQMLGMSLQPAYGADPELVYKEFLLSQRFDAEKLMLTDEKKAEMAKRQPPEDPRIVAAKINAQARIELEKMDDKDNADHVVAQAQLALQRQKFEAQEAELNRQNALVIAAINERMQSTQLTSGERQNLDKIKSTLAQTAAKLRVQKDLSMQAITPPNEPAGRAPNGQSYQR